MDCPRCQSPLEDPNGRFCPLCGASIPRPETPPNPEPVIAGPPPPAPAPARAPEASAGSGARCAVHGDRAAVDICSRCGSFACRECLVIGIDGQGVCSACLARQGGESGPLPWENRGELGMFKAYWETTKAIMFNPTTAFDRVRPETGNWWDPLTYAILSNFLGASGVFVVYGAGGLFAAIAAMATRGSGSSELGPAAILGIVLAIIAGIAICIPLGAIAGAFLMAGLQHLALKIVGASTREFETSLRVVCYGVAPMFWGVVPFCGSYVYPIWQLVCTIYGHKALHRIPGGKAAAGVLLPFGLCCGAIVLFYGVMFAAQLAGH